jgi:hypothetical protein
MTDDARIVYIAREWIAYQRSEEPRYEWAVDESYDWIAGDDYLALERFVRALVAQVDCNDGHVLGMIGAGPLEDLVEADPERALAFLEAEIESNTALREALTEV